MVKKISEAEFNEVKGKDIAVIDFSAGWCGPCKMLAPLLEEVSEEYGDKVAFYNVDVDDNQNLAMEYNVTSIPALAILKNGELADMQVGFCPKAVIVDFINAQM